MARDPVCGMEVEPDKAAAVTTYNGEKYYFCAEGCRHQFDREPGKYLKGPGSGWAPLTPKKESFIKRLFSSR